MNRLELRNQRIKEFKKRMEADLEFCKELYRYATVRILAAKYMYYSSGKIIMRDDQYDGEEESWYIMGRALGLLEEDETSPCVGFDENHELAKEAIQYAATIPPVKNT